MDHDVRTQPIGERRARDGEGGQQLRNQWPILAAGALSTPQRYQGFAVAVADDTVTSGCSRSTPPPAACFVIQAGCSPAVPTGCRIRRLCAA